MPFCMTSIGWNRFRKCCPEGQAVLALHPVHIFSFLAVPPWLGFLHASSPGTSYLEVVKSKAGAQIYMAYMASLFNFVNSLQSDWIP